MVDPGLILRTWLLSKTSITSLLGTSPGGSIYVGDLPAYFDTANGPGIQLIDDGGEPHSEIIKEVQARLVIKVWAPTNSELIAKQIFRACYDVVHGASGVDFPSIMSNVVWAQCQGAGQLVSNPDTDWSCCLGIFTVDCIDLS